MSTSRTEAPTRRLPLALMLSIGLMAACHQQHAADEIHGTATDTPADATHEDDPYAAEGERRARAVARQRVGQPGPTAVLTTIDGDRIDLASLRGRMPVYLKFWATWCGPCREQMPGFEQIYQAKGDRLQVIAVNTGFTDTEDQVHKYRDTMKLGMPVVIDDGALAAVLDLRVTPQHVLIDRNGLITYVGHRDGAELDHAIEQVLADTGEPASTNPERRAANTPVIAEGDPVGELSVTLASGERMSLGGEAPLRRAVLFFSPWCESYLAETRPAVSAQCQRYREAVETLAKTGDVEWVAVSNPLWASVQDLADYREATETRVPLALDVDGSIFRAFGVRQVPSVAVIDRHGTLVEVLSGDASDIGAALAIAP